MTGDRPSWADIPTEEYTLPQRIRDDQAQAYVTPAEVPAWLLQPTGGYREVIARIRENHPPQ
ncbi:hypothetical protein Cs7R123_13000 [Catellatospora sp. TT07R-123]|uniref:hypothetical protein n=1 Tax=Catellatospora sp. TT07R-123 TaxID=2733863 RepID=UPI001B0390BF|nr:hypothetical protein [Catellatospora sp. TT07R-123]GHJ43958.1 hypothetical protein Cs7R123_13000 [Catellatospora sp. TT07R-123]